MKLETAQAIVNAADEIDLMDVELNENYSGRGMYGRTTSGVVFKRYGDLLRAVALASVRIHDQEECMSGRTLPHHHFLADLNVMIDAMGLGHIAY